MCSSLAPSIYEARTTEFIILGRIPVLKARMNAPAHGRGPQEHTGKANLFVIFGEPDITLLPEPDGKIRVKVNGVDVFKPQTGEVVSDGAEGIASWFANTDVEFRIADWQGIAGICDRIRGRLRRAGLRC